MDKYSSIVTYGNDKRNYRNNNFNQTTADQYIAIEKFVQTIISSKEPGYRIIGNDTDKKYLDTSLSLAAKKIKRVSLETSITLQVNEKIELFQEFFSNFDSRFFLRPEEIYNETEGSYGEIFNKFVEQIRSLATSDEYSIRFQQRERKCRDRYNKTIKFLDKILLLNPTISCLWLDLQCKHPSSIKEVKLQLNHLLNNHRNNRIFESAVGYIWRIEYDINYGYSFYLIYIFSHIFNDCATELSEEIGKYWYETVTQKSGLYFSHEFSENDHWFSQLSKVERADLKSVKLLYRAAAYLAKKDLYIGIPELAGKFYGLGQPNKNDLYQ